MYPIHLNLGFRIFYYYEGLYFFLAILAAALVAVWRQKRAGLDPAVFQSRSGTRAPQARGRRRRGLIAVHSPESPRNVIALAIYS